VLGRALAPSDASVGRLAVAGVADLCLFDPASHWVVRPQALRSQGRHTPFAGHELAGRIACTIVAGRLAFEAAE
jgi:dihydroorotase